MSWIACPVEERRWSPLFPSSAESLRPFCLERRELGALTVTQEGMAGLPLG